MNWPFDKCHRIQRRLALLACGVLGEAEQEQIKGHLGSCGACRAKLAELESLVVGLAELARSAAPVEPPASLGWRWRRAVLATSDQQVEPGPAVLPFRLSGRGLAWGGLAASWVLILFFRFSAPDLPQPTAAVPVGGSLREVLLALEPEARRSALDTEAGRPAEEKHRDPSTLPPRGERWHSPATTNFNRA